MWIIVHREQLSRMKNRPLFLLIVITYLLKDTESFNPTLSVTHCLRNSIDFTLSDAVNSGIVYIQESGVGCRHVTFFGSHDYSFNLTACNISSDRPFRIVVQKLSSYHTVEDKVFLITCTRDLSRVHVSARVETLSGRNDLPIVYNLKPRAVMSLTSGGRSVIDDSVQLGDRITLDIKLIPKFTGDYDIRVSTCTVSSQTVISAGCPTDPDIFPPFSKISTGYLSTSFKAFIPTDDHEPGARTNFGCTIDICLSTCPPVTCNNIRQGNLSHGTGEFGRTTSNLSHGKLSVNTTVHVDEPDTVSGRVTIKNKNQAFMFNMITPGDLTTYSGSKYNICMTREIFIVSVSVVFVLVALSIYLCVKVNCRNKMETKTGTRKEGVERLPSLQTFGIKSVAEPKQSYCYHGDDEQSFMYRCYHRDDDESYRYYHGGDGSSSSTDSVHLTGHRPVRFV